MYTLIYLNKNNFPNLNNKVILIFLILENIYRFLLGFNAAFTEQLEEIASLNTSTYSL